MKIFICGYNLYGYLNSIAKGFTKAECSVFLFSHKNISIRKLKKKGILKRAWTYLRLKQINTLARKSFSQFNPDITLCINASSLFPETIKSFSKRSETILWLIDSVERVATDINTVSLFKNVLVFEPTDKEKIPNAEYLPYGFDEEIYYKRPVEKIYDISFVGAGHKERYEPLNRIAEVCKTLNIRFCVFGPFRLFNKMPWYRKKYPFLYESIVLNRRLHPSEVNLIYNQSWININVYHPQSKEGLNPRTFEIAGSGNFQLMEEKSSLRLFFDKDEIITYSDLDEVKEKISYFLRQKKEILEISKKAYNKAIQKHTFKHRAKYILEMLK